MTVKDLTQVAAVSTAIMALVAMWLLLHAHPLLPIVTVVLLLGAASVPG